jgi:hypothetical protein
VLDEKLRKAWHAREIKFDYGIQSNLPAQPESPAALGPKFLDTLDALSRIDPEIFTNWTIPVIPGAEWLIDQVERFGVAAAIKKTETYSLEAARPPSRRLSRRMSRAMTSASRIRHMATVWSPTRALPVNRSHAASNQRRTAR